MTTKRFKTFIPFILSICLWSMFFGGFKFLIKNLTAEPLGVDPAVLLERAVGFLSIGGIIAYIAGSIILKISTKRNVIFRDAAIATVLLVVHYMFALQSSSFFAIVTIVIGIFYGVFAVARSIITYIEMGKTGLPDTTVNGIATIAFMVSLIMGAFISTFLFEAIGKNSFWLFCALLIGICIVSFFLQYEAEEKVSFPQAISQWKSEAIWIAKRRWAVIFATSSLWAIATVVTIKSVPYAQHAYNISESSASFILLYSAIGAIIGNVVTLKVQNRWLWFRIYTYIFAGLVALFYLLTPTFWAMVVYSIFVGLTMGAATNLIDAYYLHYIGSNNVKETGVSLNGLTINGLIALLMFSLQLVERGYQFVAMGILAVIVGLAIRIKLRSLEE